MAGYAPFGIQSQRRLTRMYTDTKSSLDFVSKPAANEDEELKKLHRKLRIQKDRLTTWGLRWSETSETTSGNDDIDESLSRAGLADVVGSIMGTIKDILAEAEPLWQASGSRTPGFSSRAAEKAAEAKVSLVRWDKSRFEDLVKDLTSSIDTLYDISRMRHGEPPKANSKKNIELVVRQEKEFEKARMDTPQIIDPKRLRDFNGARIVSVNDDGSESLKVEGGKQILCLEVDNADQQTLVSETPVLVEFVTYDTLYSFTGIGPPMTRFEKLFNALQREENGSEKADFGSLKLIGYFEESQNSRFALVYELPERLKAELQTGRRKFSAPIPYYARLGDVLSHRSLEPPLEVKYRLAYNLATSVFDLHSRGVVHGNLALSNITFFETHAPTQQQSYSLGTLPGQLSENEQILLDIRSQAPALDWKRAAQEYNQRTGQDKKVPALQMMHTRAKEKRAIWPFTEGSDNNTHGDTASRLSWESETKSMAETRTDDWLASVDLRRPYLTSYDLFPEPAPADGSSLKEPSDITWYRHRLDPRLSSRSPLTMESQQLDLFALALLLVDIGLWQSSKEMQHGITVNSLVMNVKEDPASVCKLLAARCGTSYKHAFQACFEAMGSTSRASQIRSRRSDVDLQKVYGKVLSCLEKCCAIEEDEGAEDTTDTGFIASSSPLFVQYPVKVTRGTLGPQMDVKGFHNPKTNTERVWRGSVSGSQVHVTPEAQYPIPVNFVGYVGYEKKGKPEKDTPHWEKLVDHASQGLSAPIEDSSPPQPRSRGRWVPRSRRTENVALDKSSKDTANLPEALPNVGLGSSVPQTASLAKDVPGTPDDNKDTTWSELDYDDSVFSGDDGKSNPTTMSRRTSMSRRTKRSQSQAIQPEEDVTPAEPMEIDSDNIPARRTRVRFEEPSPWLWKSISPESPASKDEAKVVTVSCSSLRSILRKPTISCLILDLRVPPLYAQSRIRGALNVCVPATQLADPTFDLAKLASTFKNSEERVQVLRWQEYEYIFVYDTQQKEEGGAPFNTIKKFSDAGWTGRAGILEGGFESFAQVRDGLIDWSLPFSMETSDDIADGGISASGKAAMQGCQGCRRRKIKCDAPTTRTWPCSSCIGRNLDCVPLSVPVHEPRSLADKAQPDQKNAERAGADSTALDICAMQGIEVINHGIERARKHLNELYSLADKDQPNQKEAERADAELNSLRVQRRIAVMQMSKKEQCGERQHHASSSTVAKEDVRDEDPVREATDENEQNVASNESIELPPNKDDTEAGPNEKPRRFPAMQIMQEHLDTWHKCLMPQINDALRSFYRKHSESVEITLETIGESPQKAKPTILVICTSVGKVKSVLKRRFNYDAATYGLMVCKGKIVRSGARKRRPRRSMLHGEDPYYEGKNTQYQQRPLNGASIGAHCEGRALNAVSFGGMVMIDGEPFGMSVHHMLDVPSDEEFDDEDESLISTVRSSENDSFAVHAPFVPDAPEYGIEFSEYDSDTASYVSSDCDSDSESEKEPGDIGGIAPEDCEEGYLVTQPAFQDVEDDYFRDTDHMDEYLDNYTVGRLHASSGIRRRYHGPGDPHEIDWALFKFNENRMPTGNHIVGASTYCSTKTEYPTSCVPFDDLPRLQVHAIGRTTGLCSGTILEARASVKMKGRVSPAQSYMISGGLGVPGDSGAWIMENKKGRACGHVLAWNERLKYAYFSPMEIMLEDIKETLGAESVGFPEVKVGTHIRTPEVEMEEYVAVNNSLAELTGLNRQSVERNERPHGLKGQGKRPMTPRGASVTGQRKRSLSDLDIVGGIDGMCLSGGRILQSSAL